MKKFILLILILHINQSKSADLQNLTKNYIIYAPITIATMISYYKNKNANTKFWKDIRNDPRVLDILRTNPNATDVINDVDYNDYFYELLEAKEREKINIALFWSISCIASFLLDYALRN